jgi:hypothetical protein
MKKFWVISIGSQAPSLRMLHDIENVSRAIIYILSCLAVSELYPPCHGYMKLAGAIFRKCNFTCKGLSYRPSLVAIILTIH